MQKRRVFLGRDFRGVVCACIALLAMAGVGSFAQGNSSAAHARDSAARVAHPQHPDRPSPSKPDLEEIKRLKRELRDSITTQPAVAIQITSIDDKKIAATALREERARIREELKANSRTQKQRTEEARQEASRRIAEAKERARDGRQRD
jgi:hypothetical protein